MSRTVSVGGTLGSISGPAFTPSEEAVWNAVKQAKKHNPSASPRETCESMGIPFSTYLTAHRKITGRTRLRTSETYDPTSVATDREAFGWDNQRGRPPAPPKPPKPRVEGKRAPWWVEQGKPHPMSKEGRAARLERDMANARTGATPLEFKPNGGFDRATKDDVTVVIIRGSAKEVAAALQANLAAILGSVT